MFSCEFCEISKNTFFTEHLRATASICLCFHENIIVRGVIFEVVYIDGKRLLAHLQLFHSLFILFIHFVITLLILFRSRYE